MEFTTLDISRADARQQAAEYARAAKTIGDPRRRREFEEIARAYKAAAAVNTPLISLTATIRAGGVVTKRLNEWAWDYEGKKQIQVTRAYALPCLAVCRWDAAAAYTLGVEADGSVRFIDSLDRGWNYRSGIIDVDARMELGEHRPAQTLSPQGRNAFSSMVPLVPPKHRPTRGMGNRLVLWEVDEWKWQQLGPPPGDPALLRPLGGDLYAVEAVWDLTDLEKFVLAGRRS